MYICFQNWCWQLRVGFIGRQATWTESTNVSIVVDYLLYFKALPSSKCPKSYSVAARIDISCLSQGSLRASVCQGMLNDGAIAALQGWMENGKYRLITTTNQQLAIPALFSTCLFEQTTMKNAHLQLKEGSTAQKSEIRICPHLGLDQNFKEVHLCGLYTGRRLYEPIWVSWRNGKLRAVAQMAQGFGSALRWEKFGLVGWRLDSKKGRCRNVVSYLQPSKHILVGSKPNRTWLDLGIWGRILLLIISHEVNAPGMDEMSKEPGTAFNSTRGNILRKVHFA